MDGPPAPPRIPPQELVAHASFVRRVALAILRDETDADDVAQDALLAALDRGPRDPAACRSWLATVARHAAAGLRRRAGRLARRERRAARPEATAPTGDLAARAEVLRLVGEAVYGLDHDDRALVILRHYDGLPPRAIAARFVIPVTTVKSRLQRAHRRLRQALERRGRGWREALLLLVGPGPAAVPATRPPIAAYVTGGAAMGAKVKVAGLAALLAACGWIFWAVPRAGTGARGASFVGGATLAASDKRLEATTEPGLLDVAPERAGGGASSPRAADLGSRSPGVGASEGVASPGPAAADPEGSRSIAGVVTLDGRPLGGGVVRVVCDGGRPAQAVSGDPDRAVLVGGDGSFRIPRVRVGPLVLVAEFAGVASREVKVHVGDEAPRQITIALGSGRVWGTVFDGAGRPAAGVSVTASSYLRAGDSGLVPSAQGDPFAVREQTDAWGGYEFRGLPSGDFVLVAEPSIDRSDTRNLRSFAVTLGEGEDRRLDIGSPREDPTWSGVVRYADGEPVNGGGNVFLQAEGGETRLYVSFDAAGRFAQQVPPGRYRMEFLLVRGASRVAAGSSLGGKSALATLRFPPLVRVATEERLTIEAAGGAQDIMLPGVRVEGRVEGLARGPRDQGQQVVLTRIEPRDGTHEPDAERARDRSHAAAVAADGTFCVDGLEPGTYAVGGSPRDLRVLGGPATIDVPHDAARVDLLLAAESD